MKCQHKSAGRLTIHVKTHSCITRKLIKDCVKTDKKRFCSEEAISISSGNLRRQCRNGRVRTWSALFLSLFSQKRTDYNRSHFLFMHISWLGQSWLSRNWTDIILVPQNWQSDVQQYCLVPLIMLWWMCCKDFAL